MLTIEPRTVHLYVEHIAYQSHCDTCFFLLQMLPFILRWSMYLRSSRIFSHVIYLDLFESFPCPWLSILSFTLPCLDFLELPRKSALWYVIQCNRRTWNLCQIFYTTWPASTSNLVQTGNMNQSPRVVVATSISIANRGTSNFTDNLDRWIDSQIVSSS